jgi:DNA-binding NarL/FixJ family response regulator
MIDIEPIKTSTIKVSIIEDDKSYRYSLKKILQQDSRIVIYGEYSSAEDFLNELNSPFQPDICLIDVVLKKKSGIDCAKIIKDKHPEISIIIMTAYPDVKTFAEVRKLGVDYIEKGTRIETIIDKIITITKSTNEEIKSSLISVCNLDCTSIKYMELANLLEESKKQVSKLSKTQIEVLKLRREGKSIQEVADELNIGKGTVHTHLTRAMKKLKLPNLLDYILD